MYQFIFICKPFFGIKELKSEIDKLFLISNIKYDLKNSRFFESKAFNLSKSCKFFVLKYLIFNIDISRDVLILFNNNVQKKINYLEKFFYSCYKVLKINSINYSFKFIDANALYFNKL